MPWNPPPPDPGLPQPGEFDSNRADESQLADVDDELVPARFYMRVLAYLLDSVVVAMAIGLIGAMVWDPDTYAWPEEALANFAIIFGYYVALEAWRGQTLGKRLCRLRVVMVDGSPANLRAILARRFTFFLVLSWMPVILAVLVGWEVAFIASLLGLVALITTVFSSPLRQGFHDRVGSTRVVETGLVVPWKESLGRHGGEGATGASR
jgi:uncharacterized RDD family membrane protein YckC